MTFSFTLGQAALKETIVLQGITKLLWLPGCIPFMLIAWKLAKGGEYPAESVAGHPVSIQGV